MRNKTYTQHDGTPKVLSTSRQEGTTLYFTSRGDDISNQTIGNGTALSIENPNGLSSISSECQFLEDIYIKDGFAFWQNAEFGDNLSVEIVLPANTPLFVNAQTGNFDKTEAGEFVPNETWEGNYLILPMDYVLDRFVNKVIIMGDNTHGLVLESSTTANVPKECKFKITIDTPSSNPNIKMAICLEIYRSKTV